MGANAVSTSPRAGEILGEHCSYCEPDNIESIKEAIKIEYFKQKPKLPSSFRNEYTWENTAKKTLKIYNDVMKETEK